MVSCILTISAPRVNEVDEQRYFGDLAMVKEAHEEGIVQQVEKRG